MNVKCVVCVKRLVCVKCVAFFVMFLSSVRIK